MPRTIFHVSDYPDLVELWRCDGSDGLGPQPEISEDTDIFAPCCGRRVIACAVADVRGIKGTIVAGGGVRPPIDHDWLCDGCRHRLFLDATNDWTESKLLEARGAPILMVHWHRAEEWRAEMVQQCSRRGETHNPQEFHELAMEQITLIHRRDSELLAAIENPEWASPVH
jgi:hypothetical protein